MDRARILITAITDLATGRRRTVAPDDPMNSDERRRVLEAAAMAVDSGAGAHARVLQGGSGISVDFGIAIPPTSVAGGTCYCWHTSFGLLSHTPPCPHTPTPHPMQTRRVRA